ncbi:MAG: single-stranded DNA-binding protein [Bacillota bacterium]
MLEVTGIGRLTQDLSVEKKKTKTGDLAFCQMRLAFDNGKDKDPTFANMDLWGKQAENAAEYLEKGSRVSVRGAITNNNYKNKEGENVYSDKMTIKEIQYLDMKKRPQDLAK